MKHYQHVIKEIADLSGYESNSRTHGEDQIKQIEASITEFGFTNPVMIDEDNGIIAGHGRVTAAANLGIKDLPCVVITGLDQHQKSALIIADNKLALSAGWNFDALKSELNFLGDAGFDVSLTGFSLEDFNMDDDLFDEGDFDKVTGDPKKTDDGYVEFAMVMPSEYKQSLMSTINEIKKKFHVEVNHEAVKILVDHYAKG